MGKRKKIILMYQYNENWIGGTYYIQNLIHALNHLPDYQKPLIKIVADTIEEFEKLKQTTNYAYLNKLQLIDKDSFKKRINIFFRVINRVGRRLLGSNLFNDSYSDFDLLFPASLGGKKFKKKVYLFWIPDFQEHYLPDFFAKNELDARANFQNNVAKLGKHIIFSSEDAKSDFNKFYPENKLRQFVLQFAVSHPLIGQLSIIDLRKKYCLPENYFFCSNQFWIHKNHKVILQAMAHLKEDGKDITVAFSGKEYDFRMPDYFDQLKKIAVETNISENVKFLGFIDREEQLTLMKNAVAVLQPSLFEGWSTVIEDAKYLNSKIIASNLRVHQEQLKNYTAKLFFNPNSPKELATNMLSISNFGSPSFNYEPLIIEYGKKFMELVDEVCQ